ncbi:MAG: hypothetical protein PHT96_14595 [Syntrophorhabdaceae bacterium]|nr:hypothetical protein [Syntrophorhabdaceae bacterium]HOC45469.1 hypothetical protein [Syntrophorhabdaceae bacterium]
MDTIKCPICGKGNLIRKVVEESYEIKPIIIKYDLTARKAMLSKPNSELLSLINEMTGVL